MRKNKKKIWLIILLAIVGIILLIGLANILHFAMCGAPVGNYIDCMPPYETEEKKEICEKASKNLWCEVVY